MNLKSIVEQMIADGKTLADVKVQSDAMIHMFCLLDITNTKHINRAISDQLCDQLDYLIDRHNATA